MKWLIYLGFSLLNLWTSQGVGALASELKKSASLPEEVEAIGGQSAAMVQSGVASVSDQSAIRLNPAMLYLNRSYDVGGGYFWPSRGRPFYKFSVIDGVTSRMVAGFEYTGFQDSLKNRNEADAEGDSPVQKRGSVAVAVPTDHFVLGFSGHYIETTESSPDNTSIQNVKGITLGAGLVALLTPETKAAVSLENFNNRRVSSVAPQTIRAGLSWEQRSGGIGVHGELRQRQRSEAFEISIPEAGNPEGTVSEDPSRPEQMALTGVQVKTFDLLKIFAGAGRTVNGAPRDVLSAGIGVFQKSYSLSYATSKSSDRPKGWQGSLHFSLAMKI